MDDIQNLQEIGRQFWNTPKFLNEFEHRYICFGQTRSIPKRKTRYTKDSAKHASLDDILRIDWPANIRFKRLAGTK